MSGIAAYNAVTLISPLDMHPNSTARVAYSLIAAGAASLCDLDSCGATASRSFGWGSELVAAAISWISHGHREGTHSGVGITAFTGYTAGTLALLTTPVGITWPTRIPSGWIQAIAGVLLAGLLMFCLASMLEALHWARRHTADLTALAVAGAVVAGHAHIPGLDGIPVAVAIGIAAHIAGDMLTEHGCPLLWPWSERRYHLVPDWLQFSTGTLPEHAIAVGLTAADLWFAWSFVVTPAITTR